MSNAYVDPWDMPNNFCFHVQAENSVFLGENGNAFFDTTSTLTREWTNHRAGSQLNNNNNKNNALQSKRLYYKMVSASSEHGRKPIWGFQIPGKFRRGTLFMPNTGMTY